jgi:hypothetical protein
MMSHNFFMDDTIAQLASAHQLNIAALLEIVRNGKRGSGYTF